MAQYKITQTRSSIGTEKKIKASLMCLGLRRIGSTVTVEKRPEIDGVISKVAHLIKFEVIK
jgi:large subunit ribosomal protein L30